MYAIRENDIRRVFHDWIQVGQEAGALGNTEYGYQLGDATHDTPNQFMIKNQRGQWTVEHLLPHAGYTKKELYNTLLAMTHSWRLVMINAGQLPAPK